MTSKDLLSYSIMNANAPGSKISLPPISLPSLNSLNLPIIRPEKVILPSIQSINQLTESNLQDFDINYTTKTYLSDPSAASSLTSSPKASVPSLKNDAKSSNSNSLKFDQQKRRQRLGPSCDACRLRKVKCNAEIIILSNNYKTFNLSQFTLPASDLTKLLSDNIIKFDNDWSLIISNSKLIKFRACKSCCNKNLNCWFSKGFTKDDIIKNKKAKKESSPDRVKKTIDNSRKSSCFNCRKRKIKCTTIGNSTICENCTKKNSTCHFN